MAVVRVTSPVVSLGGCIVGLLDRLLAPFKSGGSERRRVEDEQIRARREAYLKEMMEEFADAEHIEPKPYHELSIGEAKSGKTPAVEYFVNSHAVRLHHLLPPEQMRLAALIKSYGMRVDDLPEGEVGEIVDVKPTDQAAVEHGAVNIGPVPEFKNARGTTWRFFIELSYSAASSSGRGGIQTRRFIADCTL
jgi:hypothetical protein